MNVNIPRHRRYPRQPIVRRPDWAELIKRWTVIKLPPNPVANEQFAIAD